MSDEAASQVKNARAFACGSCRQCGWLPVVLALSVTSGFCFGHVDAADPVLAEVPADRRATLVAAREDTPDGVVYRFDIHMQGDNETVFFDV